MRVAAARISSAMRTSASRGSGYARRKRMLGKDQAVRVADVAPLYDRVDLRERARIRGHTALLS